MWEIFEFYCTEFKYSGYSNFNSSTRRSVLLCLESGKDPNFTYISKKRGMDFFELEFGKKVIIYQINPNLYI